MFEGGEDGGGAFDVTPDLPAGLPTHVGAVAAVLAAEPGSPGAMALLAAADPAGLDLSEQIDLIVAWERQAAWVAAHQLTVVAALTDEDPQFPETTDVLPDLCREELATALHISGGAAQRLLSVAGTLRDRIPDTAAALAQGELSYHKAALIADRVAGVDDEVATTIEGQVLPRAGRQTPGELRGALTRAVLTADPDGAAQRAARAAARRRISTFTLADGMGGMWTELPAEDLATVLAGLDADAARMKRALLAEGVPPADVPCLDARRVDALVEWARRSLAEPDPPTYQRRRPTVHVTVAIGTLLGLDEQPGELAGFGPIDAATARRIAADGTWRRLLTDPESGALRDYGRTVYQPPADLREFILARDPVCVFPGCRRPARRCQIDHLHAWEAGGCTCDGNLAPECPRHHRCKTIGGWQVTRGEDGVLTWTSPAGKTYTVEPTAVGPPLPSPPEAAEASVSGDPPEGRHLNGDLPEPGHVNGHPPERDQFPADDELPGSEQPSGEMPTEDPPANRGECLGDDPPF